MTEARFTVYAEMPDGRSVLLGKFETPHDANKFALGIKYTVRPALCEYCGPGILTGLPGNACENCMNTGLKYPETLKERK